MMTVPFGTGKQKPGGEKPVRHKAVSYLKFMRRVSAHLKKQTELKISLLFIFSR